jgi:WD40 repeat protein
LTGPNNDVLLFFVDSGTLLHRYESHQKDVNSIVFRGDSNWVISGGFDGLRHVWDVCTHELVKRVRHSQGGVDGTILKIVTNPEVPFYAVSFLNGTIGIYNAHLEPPMMTFPAH